MTIKVIFAALAAASALGMATSALAVTPIHTYDLNGSLADSLGGPSLTSVGGSLGATGFTFSANGDGLILGAGGFSSASDYTIALDFQFTRNDRYDRILNADGSDNGLYTEGGRVDYYEAGPNGTTPFSAGVMHEIVFSRGVGFTNVYLDGALALGLGPITSFTSSLATNGMKFFIDDAAETSPGLVDAIRIYDHALSGEEVGAINDAGPTGVPEPASWAMMLVGFGGLGALLRHRRVGAAVPA